MQISESEQRRRDLVLCQTPAAAEFVRMTLAAHGISAATAQTPSVFPSLDWVQGYRVFVDGDAAEEARRILSGLSGRDDVVEYPAEEGDAPPA